MKMVMFCKGKQLHLSFYDGGEYVDAEYFPERPAPGWEPWIRFRIEIEGKFPKLQAKAFNCRAGAMISITVQLNIISIQKAKTALNPFKSAAPDIYIENVH